MRSKSRNPMGFVQSNTMTNSSVTGKSVLLPSVGSISNNKNRQIKNNMTKSPYERSALTPQNRNRPLYNDKGRPQSNKVASASNLVQKKSKNSK